MEIAGRAGGLIPTNRIALRDVVLYGDREASALIGASLERDASVVDELLDSLAAAPGGRVRHRLQLRRQRLDRRHGAGAPRNAATT